ncbi:MAG: GH92 family glycosyl hydrolase, partial [Bacteroidales bacterium]|nr:GH92 family glycosyl hydrolase [Bacteroidales bacterium]
MKKFRLLPILALILLFSCTPDKYEDFTVYVDPFIGTGGHGHTYPGAAWPFGMVQLSPDTRLTGWDGCSGYHYSDHVIYGFSHTHLSGTGVPDYGDILLMPTTGGIHLNNGSKTEIDKGYGSRFRHETEMASPGYYAVTLDDYQIDVELTVTPRTGFHKYIFPATDEANIILDLEHRDKVIESEIRIINDHKIEGFRRSDAWANDQHVYFVARFSQPFDTAAIALNGKILIDTMYAKGNALKAFFRFNTKTNNEILVKVGISAVSIEGARKNLDHELQGWNFSVAKKVAHEAWHKVLKKIKVKGGTTEQKKTFYTALYHAYLAPNLFMDVDGQYRGTDLYIHTATNFTNYTLFSLWDTFRAEHPLFTILEEKRTADFIKTMLAQYTNGGQLPVWELAGNYTGCMIGYHSVSVIVDAYMKGIRDFDANLAMEAMKHSADQDHLGLEYYKNNGYIPSNKEGESVSKTLEYAYDDWCIAQMANEMGEQNDYEKYIRRAQNYKNIFDPSTGFMRAKVDGFWFNPFDPLEVNFNYTEANSWQYSFFVPQDLEGLIYLMGGKNAFEKKLDDLFIADSKTTGREQSDITGLIGQYAHGNEPSHHMAYLYNYVNKPWKTQEKIREIMDNLYSAEPDGLCGNEDCGQMSAW